MSQFIWKVPCLDTDRTFDKCKGRFTVVTGLAGQPGAAAVAGMSQQYLTYCRGGCQQVRRDLR
jgi:hypothetical protein